jgi:peptide-methionine (S)-S-oxide reductase
MLVQLALECKGFAADADSAAVLPTCNESGYNPSNGVPGATPGNHFIRRSFMTTQKATFGAGCFWGIEAAFRRVKGVTDAAAGYAGGHTQNPTYYDVCSDSTGHAEVVQVEFDPQQVTYEQLLDVFWKIHDPTQVNCQGPDVGTQYRSVIFHHSPEQEAAARASREALDKSGKYQRRIATEIVAAGPFWRAEEYHQRYLEKRGVESCHF